MKIFLLPEVSVMWEQGNVYHDVSVALSET